MSADHTKMNKLKELMKDLMLKVDSQEDDLNSTAILGILNSLDEVQKELKGLFGIEGGDDDDCSDAEVWQNDCKVLLEAVSYGMESAILLFDGLIRSESTQRKLNEEVRLLRERCSVLGKIQKLRLKLMVRQVAFDIEGRIIDRVLTGLVAHVNTIAELEMAIKRQRNFEDLFENECDRKTAASRWAAFKDKFSWKGRHTRYIQELKDTYLSAAHPKCDLKVIREALVNCTFEVRDKNLLNEFLKIYEQKW